MGKPPEQKPARAMNWISEQRFQGWICSECEWNCRLPTLPVDPEAKTAYDRLAAGKFREHRCEDYLSRLPLQPTGFTQRIKKLVGQGFKPKDAIDILLQEVELESHGDPRVIEQARQDAEDFLRHLRAGLI